MQNLIFCLNATVPIFLLMVLGFFFRRIGFIRQDFADQINRFVFKAALPVLLFQDMASSDLTVGWDGTFVALCFGVSAVSILSMVLLSQVMDRSIRGEFVQGAYRSSVALLGVAFIQNIYGSAGAAPMMIVGAVPLYNIAAVLILDLMNPEVGRLDRAGLAKALRKVITNPILLGILAGTLWLLLGIPQPPIFQKTVSSLAAVATPLGLIGLGASVDVSKARARLAPALLCSLFKLVVFVAVFLPLAVWLGYRTDKLVTLLILLGSSTTSSSYVMARNQGYDGALTANTVMLTTFLSAFTLTGWLYLLRTFQLI